MEPQILLSTRKSWGEMTIRLWPVALPLLNYVAGQLIEAQKQVFLFIQKK